MKKKILQIQFLFRKLFVKQRKKVQAEKIVSLTSKEFPRNLLINQFGENLKKK